MLTRHSMLVRFLLVISGFCYYYDQEIQRMYIPLLLLDGHL